MWRPRQGSVLDEGAQRPCLREHVHILVLQRRRHDEVTAAAKDASSLWSLYMFAPAEGHQVRTRADERIQVECRRHFRRCIHQYRKAEAMRNFHVFT